MNEYEKQAHDFLERHGITFRAEFTRHGKHFEDDPRTRDIYECRLSREGRSDLVVPFGQSINNSYYDTAVEFRKASPHRRGTTIHEAEIRERFGIPGASMEDCEKADRLKVGSITENRKGVEAIRAKYRKVTAYDFLACIEKSNPGTFDEFCNNYGYDSDSRMVERIYNSVVQQWLQISAFFSASELDELQEIN